jgi:hypothetical protein
MIANHERVHVSVLLGSRVISRVRPGAARDVKASPARRAENRTIDIFSGKTKLEESSKSARADWKGEAQKLARELAECRRTGRDPARVQDKIARFKAWHKKMMAGKRQDLADMGHNVGTVGKAAAKGRLPAISEMRPVRTPIGGFKLGRDPICSGSGQAPLESTGGRDALRPPALPSASVRTMTAMLTKAGYPRPGSSATRLAREGVGPAELAFRLRVDTRPPARSATRGKKKTTAASRRKTARSPESFASKRRRLVKRADEALRGARGNYPRLAIASSALAFADHDKRRRLPWPEAPQEEEPWASGRAKACAPPRGAGP